MYDEAFLNDLPSNPYEAAQVLSEEFIAQYKIIPPEKDLDNYNRYIDAFAAIEAFIDATGLEYTLPILGPPRNPEKEIKLIAEFFKNLRDLASEKVHELTLVKSREKYAKLFGTIFVYQFSDGDIARIQQLLNELRDAITKSELFDAKHKQRILNKLEGLQSELHKKMSRLDGFWGLIGEAGVVLGKFGKDAKPLVDRIREIAQIIWRTQARAEELPSGTTLPLLSYGEQEDK